MKKNMKKILAFLCAVVLFVTAVFTENAMNQAQAETETSTQATSTESTPVELYGFENVTIDDFNHYQTKNIMAEGNYRHGITNFYKLFDGSNLDKKLFTTYIKFSYTDGAPWDTRIHVGGSETNTGLAIFTNANSTELTIKETNTDKSKMVGEFSKTVLNTDVGVDSFEEEFLLQIGYEYGDFDNDNGGTADDVRVLVYVEGTEVCKDYIKDANIDILGGYIHLDCGASSSVITVSSVHNPVKPHEVSGFTNVDVDDFVNSSGTPMQEKDYGNSDDRLYHLADNSNSFNKKLFTAYVKFSYSSGSEWDTRLHIGAADQYKGLGVRTNGSTLSIQAIAAADGTCLKEGLVVASVSRETVNLSSFLNNPFLLQVGYEYIDNDSVRILVFVEGIRIYDSQVDGCDLSVLGGYVHLACDVSSSVIGVSNFTEEVKPVTLYSHDTVTISDFQDSTGKEMESKAYDYDAAVPNSQFYLKDSSTGFKDKLLSMKVKFGYKEGAIPGYETRMVIGADNTGGGLFVYVDSNDILHIDDKANSPHNEIITPAAAGVSSFLNTPFIFQMSFADTSNGLEVNVYINGKLCAPYKWNDSGMNEATGDYTEHLNLNRGIENSYITVCDINEDEFPGDPLILPDSTFEKITFGSFGIVDGTYNSQGSNWVFNNELKDRTNLDKIVLCGNIKLNDEAANQTFDIVLGSKNNESWNGMKLWINGSTMSLSLNGGRPDAGGTLNSETAGVGTTFANNNFPFMWSVEFVCNGDDNKYNDIKVGLWFDNVLYEDKYFTFSDGGTAEELGNTFAVCCEGTSTSITLGSVEEYLPQPDENYDKVTFQHFLIEDGTYESEGSNLVFEQDFKMKDNLDKIVVCGDVLLTDSDGAQTFDLILGNKNNDSWQGIKLWINGSTMTLNLGTEKKNVGVLDSKTAGVGTTFANNQFAFMWSVEFVCNDGDNVYNDIEVGLWFNGFLYNNKPFTITDGGTAAELGNKFSACCETTGTSITLNSLSELIPQPDESLQKLSLPDFVHNGTTDIMESGTFSSKKTGEDWYVSGNAKDHETLDGKVVSFDILQSGTASTSSYQMRLGGKTTNHWTGLALNTSNDGTMDINWSKSDGNWAIGWQDVDMTKAAVSNFLNETFNLMVSMELVDVDGNGTSDIQVRIWFNKILYVHGGQDSIIFYDIGSELGNTLAILCSDTTNKSFVSLRTVAEYQSNPYYYEEISEYRQGNNWSDYTAPKKEGHTFSGWYIDDKYTEPVDPTTKSGSAYAKFVDDEVLTVKAQVQLDDDTLQVPTDSTSLRFVTTVDSLWYRQVAFKFAIQNTGDTYYTEHTTATNAEDGRLVYTKLAYIGADKKAMEYEPDAFSWPSKYFKAWTLSGITSGNYNRRVRVTPYWVTLDGTYVYGPTRYVSVNECSADDGAEKSKARTLDFLGENTMPIAGYGIWNTSDKDDSVLFPDYIKEQYFEMFADAGINLVNYSTADYATNPSDVLAQLKYGEKYGIGLFVTDSGLLDITDTTTLADRIKEYSTYRAFGGIYLVDEPGVKNVWGYEEGKTDEKVLYTNYTTTAAQYLNQNYLTYVNLHPINVQRSGSGIFGWLNGLNEAGAKRNYQSYVDTVLNQTNGIDSPVIMWDHYPFEENRIYNGDYDYSLYFWNMDLMRSKAQTQGKPFWAYVQAGSQWKKYNDDGSLTDSAFDSPYYPSESQFDWNVNTSLAFGAQGIQYYPLIQPYQHAYDGDKADYDFEVNGILSAWGGKTPWYYYAQEINKHIEAIDEVLMNSVSKGVVVSGDAATHTSGLSNSVISSYGKFTGIANSADAMVGCFNYNGKTALYVVNYKMFEEGVATETQSITLNFNGNYSRIKMTKNAETTYNVATTNNTLTLTDMEPGEGILLIVE